MLKSVLREYCKEDDKMSDDFLALANTEGAKLYTVTCIGLVKKESVGYLNSVIYQVEAEVNE